MERFQIIERVNEFFNEVDNCNWERVMSIFAKEVLLDYTSLNGGEPAVLKSEQIVANWANVLPGFDAMQHLVGNHIVDLQGSRAKVTCNVIASHYIDNTFDGDLWTVFGSYDIDLRFEYNDWHITMLKLNKKFITGNNNLPHTAQERLKGIFNID